MSFKIDFILNPIPEPDIQSAATTHSGKKVRLPKTYFTHEDDVRIYQVGNDAAGKNITRAFETLSFELNKPAKAIKLHYYVLKKNNFDPNGPIRAKRASKLKELTERVDNIAPVAALTNAAPKLPRLPTPARTLDESQAFSKEIVEAIDSGIKCRELAEMYNVTNESIRSRYYRATKKSLGKGNWTKDQEELLKKALEAYPNDYKTISAQFFEGMSPERIRRKANRLFATFDRSPLTEVEKQLILENYDRYTTNKTTWRKMARDLMPTRNPEDLKEFYRVHQDNQTRVLT